MNKIFETASDLHVKATKVYVKSTPDNYAYSDEKCTTKISADDLSNMFVMGMLIIDGTSEYKPISMDVASGVASVTYIKSVTATSSVTATPTVIHSKEYSG